MTTTSRGFSVLMVTAAGVLFSLGPLNVAHRAAVGRGQAEQTRDRAVHRA